MATALSRHQSGSRDHWENQLGADEKSFDRLNQGKRGLKALLTSTS